MTIFMHELGSRMRDQATGFTGTVTGRAEYIAGCRQYCLTPPVGADGTLKTAEWFDEERLEPTGENALVIAATRTGGPTGSERAPTR